MSVRPTPSLQSRRRPAGRRRDRAGFRPAGRRHRRGVQCARASRPRHAHYRPFHAGDGDVLDEGIALYFPAPAFLHRRRRTGTAGPRWSGGHGHAAGARAWNWARRLARPGEFTERAFLNDKLDLAQAEAIADLIASGTAAAARAAMRSLQGEFSQRVHELVEG